jgi:hypothetical protein
MTQWTTLTIFDASDTGWWSMLLEVAKAAPAVGRVKGVRFHKFMGNGAGAGFSMWPSKKRYSLLAVWDSKESADLFFLEHSWFKQMENRSERWFTLAIRPLEVHGQWSGQQPFVTEVPQESPFLGVITRASIRWSKLMVFWKHVPPVNKLMAKADGLIFSSGMGEYPLKQQATFSLWSSKDQMMAFAYGHEAHREVVRLTRQEKWYSEELFARFEPISFFTSRIQIQQPLVSFADLTRFNLFDRLP